MPRLFKNRRPTPRDLRNDVRRRTRNEFAQDCECKFFGGLEHTVKDRHERANHRMWQAKHDAIEFEKRVQRGAFQPDEGGESSTLIGDSSPDLEDFGEAEQDDDEEPTEKLKGDTGINSGDDYKAMEIDLYNDGRPTERLTRRTVPGVPNRPFIGQRGDNNDPNMFGKNRKLDTEQEQGLSDLEDENISIKYRFSGLPRPQLSLDDPETSGNEISAADVIARQNVQQMLGGTDIEGTNNDYENDASQSSDEDVAGLEDLGESPIATYRNLNRDLLHGKFPLHAHLLFRTN